VWLTIDCVIRSTALRCSTIENAQPGGRGGVLWRYPAASKNFGRTAKACAAPTSLSSFEGPRPPQAISTSPSVARPSSQSPEGQRGQSPSLPFGYALPTCAA
jgi:hypothetical protein